MMHRWLAYILKNKKEIKMWCKRAVNSFLLKLFKGNKNSSIKKKTKIVTVKISLWKHYPDARNLNLIKKNKLKN